MIDIHSELDAGNFFKERHVLPLGKPKTLILCRCYRKCCKSHVAPFNLFSNSISTNLDGAAEFKHCIKVLPVSKYIAPKRLEVKSFLLAVN